MPSPIKERDRRKGDRPSPSEEELCITLLLLRLDIPVVNPSLVKVGDGACQLAEDGPAEVLCYVLNGERE